MSEQRKRASISLVKRIYAPRIGGLLLALLVISTSSWEGDHSILFWLPLLFWTILWPHIAFFSAIKSKKPFKSEVRNLFIDAFIIGLYVPIISFAPVPSAAILSMHLLSLVSILGPKKMVLGFFIELVGVIVGIYFVGYEVNLQSEIMPILASIPLLIIYPLFVGYTTHGLALQLSAKQIALKKLSRTDSLTELYNRRYWEEQLSRCFVLYQRNKSVSSIVFLDVDHFKKINDNYGHVAGDEVLQTIARLMVSVARETDICGRYGGEEFSILMPSTDGSSALVLAERLREKIASSPLHSKLDIRASISIGVSEIHRSMSDYSHWLNIADKALYQAKEGGRNQTVMAKNDIKSHSKISQ